MDALAHEGPGFRQHVLDALRRVDRALDLAWCGWRRHWIVVRRGLPEHRAYWSGRWWNGYDIVARWSGVDGVYRAAFPHEKPGFLPLDNRLVALVRACDLSRRRKASERFQEAEDVDLAREAWRVQRRAERREEARKYAHDRHVLDRVTSIGGFQSGQVNDTETESDLAARRRAARNRVGNKAPEGWSHG